MALLPTGWIKMPGDNDETKRFAWSHVKSIFYNKAANILLKDKLDEMDKIIDEKIAKALMSNVQVNDQSKIPTSALAYAMQQSITKNGQDIAQLNNNLEIETNDLTNSLNPNYYDPSGDKRLRIYRVGNIKFLSILFKAKDLTGHEVIATDIPTKLRPVMACYGVIQGRDTGEWVKATYVPVVLSVGRESLTISTGVNASKAVYITGMVCYV